MWDKVLAKFSKIKYDSREFKVKCKKCGSEEDFINGTLKGYKTYKIFSFPDLNPRKRNICSKCYKPPVTIKKCKIEYNNCINCNKLFVGKRSGIKYCSKVCTSKYNNKLRLKNYEIQCEQCNTQFETNIKRKHCSKECLDASKRKPKLLKTCKTCKKGFEGHSSDAYCSSQCSPHVNRQLVRRDHSNCMKCGVKITVNRRVCDNCKVEKKEPKKYIKCCPTCNTSFECNRKQRIYCKKSCMPSHKEAKRLRKRGVKKAKLNCESWKEIYDFKKNRPEGYQLDHIIPLNHPDVCGLHNTWNFQWLDSEENLKKSNSFDGTLENISWRKEL